MRWGKRNAILSMFKFSRIQTNHKQQMVKSWSVSYIAICRGHKMRIIKSAWQLQRSLGKLHVLQDRASCVIVSRAIILVRRVCLDRWTGEGLGHQSWKQRLRWSRTELGRSGRVDWRWGRRRGKRRNRLRSLRALCSREVHSSRIRFFQLMLHPSIRCPVQRLESAGNVPG